MNVDNKRLKEFLYEKITQRKKRIHPEHNPRFNHDMQLEVDCYEWVLGKIEMNKIPFDILERIIKATIRDLEKRKDKAMVRTDTIIYGQRSKSPVGFVCNICHKKWKNGCNLKCF